jgi:nucleoside 2-deoxyribosyltransferase
MIDKRITIYLAGAIRDDHPEDIEWRELFIKHLKNIATIFNPLAGKVFDSEKKKWYLHGHFSTGEIIVPHDFWMVEHSDLIIFNFLSLAEGYPSIGTLVEFGHATAGNALLYCIIPKGYTGHDSTNQYKLHPFLAKNATMVFQGVDSCLEFLIKRVQSLNGNKPEYGDYV